MKNWVRASKPAVTPAANGRLVCLMRSRVAAAIGVFVFAIACGSVGSAPPIVSPSPSASHQLTLPDDGATISIHVGDTVEVALQQRAGFEPWSKPSSTNPTVLVPQPNARPAAGAGVTVAVFRAVAAGSAGIESTSRVQCTPGTPCPASAWLWRVHVVVGS